MAKVRFIFPYFATENESVIIISRILYACYKGGGYQRSKVLKSILTTKRYRISQKSTTPRNLVPYVNTKNKSQKKTVVVHQASSFQLSIALCLVRAGLGLVLQSSLRTSPHPATWAPPPFLLALLAALFLSAILGSGHLSIVSAGCLLYTSPSPRDGILSRMPSSA